MATYVVAFLCVAGLPIGQKVFKVCAAYKRFSVRGGGKAAIPFFSQCVSLASHRWPRSAKGVT